MGFIFVQKQSRFLKEDNNLPWSLTLQSIQSFLIRNVYHSVWIANGYKS